MNIIQFNEIIELLHSISDNSTANIMRWYRLSFQV